MIAILGYILTSLLAIFFNYMTGRQFQTEAYGIAFIFFWAVWSGVCLIAYLENMEDFFKFGWFKK